MPELPEVEAARRAIEENCLGKVIKRSVVANDSKVIDGVSHSDFEAALLGKTIVSAHRKGKNLWIRLDSPPFPSFQFGMAGAIYIKGVAVTKYKRSAVKDTDEWPSKYSKLFIELDDGMELSFTDKRRFARVRLLTDPTLVPPISELGPDALLDPMTVDTFTESLRKKKISIKPLLLDQSYISGIGNWIADEVLYQARIHPLQTAASLSKESCVTLLKCIKEVIEKAVEVGADSSQFPEYWIFHSREKNPGKAFVDGKRIDFITAGGRTTAYVPELQKLSGIQVKESADEPIKQNSKRKSSVDDVKEDIAETKPRGRARKAATKRETKREESDDQDDSEDNDDHSDHSEDDGNDDGDNEVANKKTRESTRNKQAKMEKTLKNKVQSKKRK